MIELLAILASITIFVALALAFFLLSPISWVLGAMQIFKRTDAEKIRDLERMTALADEAIAAREAGRALPGEIENYR